MGDLYEAIENGIAKAFGVKPKTYDDSTRRWNDPMWSSREEQRRAKAAIAKQNEAIETTQKSTDSNKWLAQGIGMKGTKALNALSYLYKYLSPMQKRYGRGAGRIQYKLRQKRSHKRFRSFGGKKRFVKKRKYRRRGRYFVRRAIGQGRGGGVQRTLRK